MSEHLRAAEYTVETLPFGMGVGLVSEHHYARGAANTATYRHGLFRRDDWLTPLGAALWMPPTRAAAESVDADWKRVLVLSRLVIVPEIPTNGASFLLGRSIRIIRQDGRFSTLLTYADEGQGHTGAIYQATNWDYLGIKSGDPVYLTRDGRMVARKAGGHTRTNAEMLALGYVNTGRTRKHKFMMRLT